MATGGYVTNAPAHVFDVYTIVPGGKTAVTPSSLTILSDVPAAATGHAVDGDRQRQQRARHLCAVRDPDGHVHLTFGICGPGTPTYSAGDPNCRTGRIEYCPGRHVAHGRRHQLLHHVNQYQDFFSGVTAPTSYK